MRKIWVLLVIFSGLLAFVYFYEIEGQKKREEVKEKQESLFRIERDEVTSVEVVRLGHEPILLRKEGEGWVMESPLETTADRTSIDSLLRNIETARRERTFPVGASRRDEYGLKSPRVIVKIRAGEGEKVLRIGKDDYTENQVYVQFEGDEEVHLTSDFLLTTADKDLFEWRNKKVLVVERDKVRAIEIERPAGKIVLKKRDDQWTLLSPFQESADSASVNSLLSSLEFAEVQKFVVESAEDLRPYGLRRPEVIVRIQEEGRDSWKALELGRKGESGYLARNPDRSPVFTVEQDLRDKLTQKIWEFRDKDVVDVKQDQVVRLEIRTGSEEIVLRHEERKWIVAKPEEQKGKEAFSYKFWYPIDDIRFESIGEGKGNGSGSAFAQSDVEVILTLKDDSTRRYDFARQGDRYLARRRDSARQGTISKEAFEKLHFKAEEIV